MDEAKRYISLPPERKEPNGPTWQVKWQDLVVEKVMREGLSEADQKRFAEGVTDTTLYYTRKSGRRGVTLICKGEITLDRANREELGKLAQEYAGQERTRRVLETQRAKHKAAHDEKHPPERYAEEKQTPPPFVFDQEELLTEVNEKCEMLKNRMDVLDKHPKAERVSYFFPEGEPPRFVII